MSQAFTSHHTHFTIKSCNILCKMKGLHMHKSMVHYISLLFVDCGIGVRRLVVPISMNPTWWLRLNSWIFTIVIGAPIVDGAGSTSFLFNPRSKPRLRTLLPFNGHFTKSQLGLLVKQRGRAGTMTLFMQQRSSVSG